MLPLLYGGIAVVRAAAAVNLGSSLVLCQLAMAGVFLLLSYCASRIISTVHYDPSLASPLPPGCTTPLAAEEYIRAREEAAGNLQPEAESRVLWAGERGATTDLVIIFLHGWSSSVMEIAPVDERIAQEMGANLLRFRLTGHGLQPTSRGGPAMLSSATRDALLRDVAVAFACAKLLGSHVVLLGSS